ncbi:uncharacterized protein row isoform X2 [Planococcus citri]|uniref:uncharacterized protein row isoform X2 n=1 Tax=Planococcus citri TaxID=170843 RepID=UPI0031F8F473
MGLKRNSIGKKPTTPQRNGDISLVMECGWQPLSEIQTEMKNKVEKEYNQFMKTLKENIAKRGGEIVEQGTHITVYELECPPTIPTAVIQQEVIPGVSSSSGLVKATPTSALLATSQTTASPLIANSSVLLPSGAVASSGSTVFTGQPHTYQLVMGSRMGLIVTPSTPATSSPVQSTTNTCASAPSATVVRPITAPRVQVRSGLGAVPTQPPKRLVNVAPSQAAKITVPQAPKINVNPATQKAVPPPVTKGSSFSNTVTTRSKVKLGYRAAEPSTTEPPAVTATKTGSNAGTVVDLTDDDGKPVADSREVAFNRYPGRIYPSLVVVARPNIKVKDMANSMITAERTQLDTKVKGILTNTPTKFTEWLIQQGLVRSEQVCSSHVNVDLTPIKLKLGMYSDVSKFPYSGGYVWISDCCPQKFVSVFCNSIFEGAPHAPTVLLKLIYHWACQTNVHNIISWVKVDNLYIKNFFTNLRAVCTAAICEKFGKMGGAGKKVEVGVISLGTTSQNGSVRQVKVEVLGVMDPVSKFVRLRAVDPVQNAEKNHKLRFSRILESLEHWVDKRTTIVTDFTVDKATLIELGFHSVLQVQLNAVHSKDNNQAVMDYLKKVVPRMFQNTLSLLSRSIIQQFLDELVWRERWGPIPSRAFDNVILHLSEMTKLDTGDTLINRLKSITANPFKDWSYKLWKTNSMVSIPTGAKKAAVPGEDDAKALQKNMALRFKSGLNQPSTSVKNYGKGSKTNLIAFNSDDTSDSMSIIPSIDNLPPSITEIDDDNLSVSSSSSRRSRARGSTEDRSSAPTKPWDPQLVLKSLEGFYYGTLPFDVVVVNKLRKVELNMKCFTCGHTYNNNILFMKHLAGHAQNEGAFTTDFQCRYCLKSYTTAFDLEDHLGSVHFPNKYNSMCLICGDRFKDRGALVTHMQTTHVELELPYHCSICKFRTSEHTKLIDHFYEIHDGGEKVQCPFCLKVVAFEGSNKVKLTQNVNFYFNHIKRHQRKPIRKCPKCVLSFVNKGLVNDHLSKDHTSCVNIPGIVRYQNSDLSTVLMPLPSVAPPLTRKAKPSQSYPVPNFSTFKLDNTLIYPDVPPSKCVECKTEVTPATHFTSYMTCMKCMFASCCKVVMSKHVVQFHESRGKKKIPIKRKIPLDNPLHCACGFTSSDGNAIASHLINCKRKIAYRNPEKAAQYSVQMQSASFPTLVNLDDGEHDSNEASDKWLRALVKSSDKDDSKPKPSTISEKSPPRMLKMLGLVCKESSDDADVAGKVKSPEEDDVPAKKSKLDTDESTKELDDEVLELSDDESSVTGKSASEKDLNDSSVDDATNLSTEQGSEAEKDSSSKADTANEESESIDLETAKAAELLANENAIAKDTDEIEPESVLDASEETNETNETEKVDEENTEKSNQSAEKVAEAEDKSDTVMEVDDANNDEEVAEKSNDANSSQDVMVVE